MVPALVGRATATLPRLYPILDTALLEARGCALEIAAGAILEAGAEIVQIRHKGAWSRDLYERTRRVAEICARASATLIINDRADIALLVGGGVHVGQQDLTPGEARRLIGSGSIVGYSTHNLGQLEAAANEPVDYVAIGPIFATRSKMNPDPVIGLSRLRQWRGAISKPLVAIGGITRESACAVLDAGVDSVAVISDLLPEECSARSLAERFAEWRHRISE